MKVQQDEQKLLQFKHMQLYGNYLYTYGYNSYDEIMNMTLSELKDRFEEVTTIKVNKNNIND